MTLRWGLLLPAKTHWSTSARVSSRIWRASFLPEMTTASALTMGNTVKCYTGKKEEGEMYTIYFLLLVMKPWKISWERHFISTVDLFSASLNLTSWKCKWSWFTRTFNTWAPLSWRCTSSSFQIYQLQLSNWLKLTYSIYRSMHCCPTTLSQFCKVQLHYITTKITK